MVEFPSYIKILPGNAARRTSASSSRNAGQAKASRLNEHFAKSNSGEPGRAEVVSLISRENQLAAASQVPSPEEAAAALRRLQEDLPEMGQAVGDLHSNLDRRRILDLLAPLLDI